MDSLQASLRNLVLDVTPSEQLASANAWHGRFNHVGNIVGFTLGQFDLKAAHFIFESTSSTNLTNTDL